MDRDKVEVHKLAKKERGPYPAILTEQTWSIKDLLCGFQGNFLRDTAGSPEQARWLHFARSGSHSQGAIWVILPARGASDIIIVYTKTVGHLGLSLVGVWSLFGGAYVICAPVLAERSKTSLDSAGANCTS